MRSTKQAIRALFKALSPDDMREFARVAGTSTSYLRHIAAGRRGVSCEQAVRLVNASEGRLLMEELCAGCRARSQ